ncbi:MAG: hypothetical protein JNK24_02420 [Alphaproteobacteria bacterium]|nr:hypothetical protein [Alphaproteobacteria bacterium]
MESVPSLRFYPSEKAFVKWTIIVLICAPFSLFTYWLNPIGTAVPIALGILTIILVLSMIESNPKYLLIKKKNNLLQKSINIGIVVGCVGYFFSAIGILSRNAMIFSLGGINNIVDIVLVKCSLSMAYILMKMDVSVRIVNIEELNKALESESYLFQQFFVYITTVIDGLLHSIILAFLCGIIYFIMSCLRVRKENLRVRKENE